MTTIGRLGPRQQDDAVAPTRVVLDLQGLTAWVAGGGDEGSDSEVLVVVDDAVVPLGRRVEQQFESAVHGRMRVREVVEGATLGAARALSEAIGETRTVVAVGGGRVIDLVKVAAAMRETPDITAAIDRRDRGGFLPLSSPPRHRMRVAALPTTIGTGSECSQNAVLDVRDSRLLIGGPCLAPDLAAQIPVATRGLPRGLVLSGVFEALCRTIGPYLGGAGHRTMQDELAEAIAARLVALGDSLAACRDPGGEAADALRAEVVRLGGLGHQPDLHLGRDPFGYKAWYLAHELAWTADVSKTDALALVLPATCKLMEEGISTLGSRDRLSRISRGLVASHASQHGDLSSASRLIDHILARWGLPLHLPREVDVDLLVDRVTESWGRGLPQMDGVSDRIVREVYVRTRAAVGARGG